MCYLGMGDTYTAAHKDICSSSGHNLMCFSENGGSAFWFMTESGDASKVAEYFQKVLGEELDWELHVTTLEELGNAPFNVYVAEQKVGDLVLVPPRSVHQVVNHGGLAMKTSWSRMTLRGLKTALHSELPIYRRYSHSYPASYLCAYIFFRLLECVDRSSTGPRPSYTVLCFITPNPSDLPWHPELLATIRTTDPSVLTRST